MVYTQIESYKQISIWCYT